MQSLCYNGKHIEFFDPSQVRDENGRWTSGGAGGGSSGGSVQEITREAGSDNGKQSTSVYHGTSADVLKKIRENGLQPSKDGVYGKGVYATNHLEVALEYGAMKASDAPRIGGKSYIGLIEVVSSGFEEVSKYTDPTRKTKGDKKGDSISILLKKSKVAPSEIKSMKLFDLGQVRSWIFEGGKKPDPVATKKLEAGTYYIPIVIHEDEITKLEEIKCPLPTQDIKENLANRQKAIDVAHYGPANPKESNEDYWITKAKIFGGSVKEAKTMRCGNCAGFNQTTKLIDCITKGIGMDAKEVEQAGDLGFCEIFDFKCASLRTCDAWIVGGPITDKTNLEQLKANLLSLKEQGATLLYDPSQARDDAGKWSGNGGSSLSDKLTARISKENPDIDVKDSKVKKVINAIADGVHGARVKVQYGASKINDIRNWIKSEDGQNFINGTIKALKVTSSGVVEAGREFHNERFGILTSAIAGIGIGPELAIAHGGYALLKGFVRGAVTEYRKDKGGTKGREVSNTIREVAGLKPMQACNSIVTLQAEPSDDDLIDYLTDVLAVSIKDKIRGTKTFEVTGFAFDPSQERDENGRWVSKGASSPMVEPEDENTPKTEKYPDEASKEKKEAIKEEITQFLKKQGNDPEYDKDVDDWTKSLAKNNVDPEDTARIGTAISDYTGSGSSESGWRNVNNYLRGKKIKDENTQMAVEDTIYGLRTAFTTGPKIVQDMVYRGASTQDQEGKISDLFVHKLAKYAKEGGILRQKGFTSTSLSEDVADKFAGYMRKKSNSDYNYSQVMFKIKNASGVGMKMPNWAHNFLSEKEVLFPENTKIKITKVNRVTHTPSKSFTAMTGVDKTYSTTIEGEVIK